MIAFLLLPIGYEFADDDYELDEEEETQIAKQAAEAAAGSNEASSLLAGDGEISKVEKELLALDEAVAAEQEKTKAAAVLKEQSGTTEPLAPIAEQADEISATGVDIDDATAAAAKELLELDAKGNE